VPAVGN